MRKGTNAIYIGSHDKLQDWWPRDDEHGGHLVEELDESQSLTVIDKVQELIKNYLQLDNVSFLFGAGSSIHLGSESIQSIPQNIENDINGCGDQNIIGLFEKYVILLQRDKLSRLNPDEQKDNVIEDEGWKYIFDGKYLRNYLDCESEVITEHYGKIDLPFETLLNDLIAHLYISEVEGNETEARGLTQLINILKKSLFDICDVHERKSPTNALERISLMGLGDLFKNNKYLFHEKFLKALMQRPLNLRRANIFTSNYDLAFEYAFDNLGIKYIDGFSGFHHRYFKPETFNYDVFYPGTTTSGEVQRIEKVLRYFKLHGSISWVSDTKRSSSNIYGIEEMPIELIKRKTNDPNEIDFTYGNLMIYPSAVKKSYTLDLPYSELFRHFSYVISQPQSVLFTIGYSYSDEHFNDLIYQALTNPTFTLVIVDFYGTQKSPEIKRLKDLNDPRIIILEGNILGDFLTFSNQLMPNFMESSSADKIADMMNKLVSK